MAIPRIFISSTFYDLKHIRADLDAFIRQQGYEPVRNERGAIPYASDHELEQSCYREVANCDMLISIIGGRFGTTSRRDDGSISQNELRKAIEQGKQVFIFVERSVRHEHRTYLKNADNPSIKYASVDDPRIHKFLSEVDALPVNNANFEFESAAEIIGILRAQWAGLFQRYLRDTERRQEQSALDKLEQAIQTVNGIAGLLASAQQTQSKQVTQVLLLNHPVFSALRKAWDLKFHVAFYSLDELDGLMNAWGYSREESAPWDDLLAWTKTTASGGYGGGYRSSRNPPRTQTVKVHPALFGENGALKPVLPGDWKDAHFVYSDTDAAPPHNPDDDIPF